MENLLIGSAEVIYDGLETTEEREKHNEKLVNELLERNKGKMVYSKIMPTFFIEGVQSKMNYSLVNYVDEYA